MFDLAIGARDNVLAERIQDLMSMVERLLDLARAAALRISDTRLDSLRARLKQADEFLELWRRSHRQPDDESLKLAEEIEQHRRDGWSWPDINGHHHKSERWAQNLLRSLGRWPAPGRVRD